MRRRRAAFIFGESQEERGSLKLSAPAARASQHSQTEAPVDSLLDLLFVALRQRA